MFHEIENAINLAKEKKWNSEELYTNWWSGTASSGLLDPVSQKLHNGLLGKKIFQDSEFQIVSLGSSTFSALKGEYVDLNEEMSLILRKFSWSNSWWNWFQTSHPKSYPHQRTLRIYLPTPNLDLSELAKKLNIQFEFNQIECTLKYRRQNGTFSDALVIWVSEPNLHASLKIVQSLVKKSEYLCAPPPLSKHIFGLGITDHPRQGDSYGWLVSEILWAASKINSASFIRESFENLHINLERPWLMYRENSEDSWDMQL